MRRFKRFAKHVSDVLPIVEFTATRLALFVATAYTLWRMVISLMDQH